MENSFYLAAAFFIGAFAAMIRLKFRNFLIKHPIILESLALLFALYIIWYDKYELNAFEQAFLLIIGVGMLFQFKSKGSRLLTI
jgi:hypothetical protein